MKFSKMKMNDSILTHGLCYFPNKETPVSAVLEYENNHLKLSYVKNHFIMAEETDDYKCLEFVTSEGEVLILFNGFVINQKANTRNITTYVMTFQYILVDPKPGEAFEENFTGFKFTCTYFKDVFSNSPFRFKNHDKEHFYKEIKADLKETMGVCLRNPKIEIKDNITAYEINKTDDSVLSYKYTPYLQIKFFKNYNFEDIISEVVKLKNLFSFLMDSKILVEELFISGKNKSYKVFWTNENHIKPSMKTSKLNAEVKPLVKDHFSEIISNFYRKEELLEDLFDTYVNNLYKPIYEDDFLVSQIIILEGLYTRFKIGEGTNLRNMLKSIIEIVYGFESASFNSPIHIDDNVIKFLKDFRHYHSHLYERNRKPEIVLDLYELALALKEIIHEFISANLYNSSKSYKTKQYRFEQLNL